MAKYKAQQPVTTNFDYLPIEIQASIERMRRLGTPESELDLLMERMLHALEAKTTSLQMDIVRIEDSMEARVDRIGEKLSEDLRAQHGSSNQMLVDIHGLVQSQGVVLSHARAEFHDGLSAIGERVSDNTARIGDLEQKVTSHDQSRDQSIAERRMLREDMNESKSHRARMQTRMDTDLPAIFAQLSDLSAAVERMERMLELAGGNDGAGG